MLLQEQTIVLRTVLAIRPKHATLSCIMQGGNVTVDSEDEVDAVDAIECSGIGSPADFEGDSDQSSRVYLM